MILTHTAHKIKRIIIIINNIHRLLYPHRWYWCWCVPAFCIVVVNWIHIFINFPPIGMLIYSKTIVNSLNHRFNRLPPDAPFNSKFHHFSPFSLSIHFTFTFAFKYICHLYLIFSIISYFSSHCHCFPLCCLHLNPVDRFYIAIDSNENEKMNSSSSSSDNGNGNGDGSTNKQMVFSKCKTEK